MLCCSKGLLITNAAKDYYNILLGMVFFISDFYNFIASVKHRKINNKSKINKIKVLEFRSRLVIDKEWSHILRFEGLL